ncbi:MAG: choice-of-anchor J domain-containing protein [Prevotellaceae bacterium]|jgi:hypothetical protein|nr:choice-of-anchor J domain-containing protein [Prevotellaceae bacterium]
MKKSKLLLRMGCILLIGTFTFSACEEEEYSPDILSQLAVSPTSISVNSERNEPAAVKILADRAWSVTCDSSWVHFNKTGGNGDDEFIITVDNSLVKVARTATVLVKTDNITREITVKQSAYEETITLTPATASVKATSDTVRALITTNISSGTVSFSTDVNIYAGVWRSENKDTLLAVITENPTSKDRVSSLRYTLKNEAGSFSGSVRITQSAASIKVSKKLVTVPAAGDTADYVITANVPWEFTQSGEPSFDISREEDIITIKAPANTTGQPRSGRFIFKQVLATGTVADTLDIIQHAAGASIVVTPATIEIAKEGGAANVSILATQDWTYAFTPASAATWAQVQQKKDSSGLSLKILANTGPARAATVTLTSIDKKASASFTITQEIGIITLFVNTFATQAEVNTWSLIDKDGDGYNWSSIDYGVTGLTMISRSWINTAGPLTPENYLISPQITIPGGLSSVTLQWLSYSSYGNEHYKVIVSETPITAANCSDIPAVFEETLARTNGYLLPKEADLTAYVGKKIYIAFVHYNCTDQEILGIDNVEVVATL